MIYYLTFSNNTWKRSSSVLHLSVSCQEEEACDAVFTASWDIKISSVKDEIFFLFFFFFSRVRRFSRRDRAAWLTLQQFTASLPRWSHLCCSDTCKWHQLESRGNTDSRLFSLSVNLCRFWSGQPWETVEKAKSDIRTWKWYLCLRPRGFGLHWKRRN